MIMNDKLKEFNEEKLERIHLQRLNTELLESSKSFMEGTILSMYSYNFSWLGVPIIQYPQDMIAMQEIIWEVQPDLIIETGIAHGGSIVYYGSLLELIGKEGLVVGIDIDIRKHNRDLIEAHPMFKRIHMIEGSSVCKETIEQVAKIASTKKKIMVCLDSNHTHEHVLEELKQYSPFVSIESYCVVFDTVVEDMTDDLFSDRPWGKGNNPKTAVWEFLKTNSDFIIDKNIEQKLLVTSAPDGYLKRVK